MLWSILICGIPERYHAAQPLLYDLLETQGVNRMSEVELLYLMDNRRRTVGAKRNALLEAARGEYISFVDDDDKVAPDYVKRIYKAIAHTRREKRVKKTCDDCGGSGCEHCGGGHPNCQWGCKKCGGGGEIYTDGPADVICFPQRATIMPQGIVHECSYSLAHWKDRPEAERRKLEKIEGRTDALAWSGPPAHTMVWRQGIAGAVKFPEKQFGEDVEWVDRCCALAVREVQLGGEPLYFYQFDQEKSATR